MNVNKQKLKILIKNLEQDIEEVNKKIAISSLFNDKNRSILSRELTSEELVSLRNSLEEKYISTSAQYKGLLFILEKRSFNITQLSKYLSFSKSYTYKILDKISFFLSTIDNKLYFSKLNETFIILTGDEIVIRLLHLHLISIKKTNEEILGLSDMFIQDYLNSLKRVRLSPASIKKLKDIFIAYGVSRKKRGTNSVLPNDIIYLASILSGDVYPMLCVQSKKFKFPKKTSEVHENMLQVSLLSNFFLKELKTKKEKIHTGKKLSEHKNINIISGINHLIKILTKKFKISKENYFLLVYLLCHRIIVVHYFKFYIFMEEREPQMISSEIIKFTQEAISKALKYYRYEKSFKKLTSEFSIIIVNILTDSTIKPINVYIELENKYEYIVIIKKTLKMYYRADLFNFVENYYDADLIISNSYIPDCDRKFKFFCDIYDSKSILNVINHLNAIVVEHLYKFNDL
ncbi:helix-turn-helix domain-containing protein [Enterococcus faecalis]